uniref:Argininosuccinate lyase n=1 Tax=Anthurium amnicola TaxID=1678845 RepID=A0A1D1ZBQ0_9ARAE
MRGCAADGSLNDSDFAKPLPTIGLYITGASLCCAAAMGWDTFRGFRSRRLWFPARYFTLNAATLTLLAVATKLPVDLNTSMPGPLEQLSKLSGTVLLCTVMGNLTPSLGVTDNAAANIIALGILVATVVVNVAIQMGTGVIYVYRLEHAVVLFFMLVLLLLLSSSSLTVPTTKRLLEKQYDRKHHRLANDMKPHKERAEDEGGPDDGRYDAERLQEHVKKYWLMAHTSSPQYVLGRLATCTASGAFCLLSALALFQAALRSFVARGSGFCNGTSDYTWSIHPVFISQAFRIWSGTRTPSAVSRCSLAELLQLLVVPF